MLRQALVLWVNPQRVEYSVGSQRPIEDFLETRLQWMPQAMLKGLTRVVRKNHPFVISKRWYPNPEPIEALEKYQKVENLFHNRERYEYSVWFAELTGQVHSAGFATHKDIVMHTEEDVHAFFRDYACALIDSMRADGYRNDKARDTGAALIGPGGEVHKSGRGNHRFYVARLTGASPIPLRVSGVHESWFAELRRAGNGRVDPEQLAAALREVEARHQ